MKYVLMEYTDQSNYTASSKARDDVVNVLKGDGAVYVPLFQAKTSKLKVLFTMMKSCCVMALKLKKGDDIFIQYPYNPQVVNQILISILSKVCKIKSSNLWVIMHDINSFRFTSEHEREAHLEHESKLLNEANCLVVHNERMAKLLLDHGCKAEMRILGFFDYLYEGNSAKTIYEGAPHIIIAGNLSEDKAGYLYKLPELDAVFELYGVNYNQNHKKAVNVIYHGAFPPDRLIENLEGSFGLVWDGVSCETCEGNYGTYLRYNDPHKFSLYVASGLPVIVWDQSALAKTVKQLGIGITISSLSDISRIRQIVSLDDYQTMKRNVEVYCNNVKSGQMLRKAIL